MKKILLGLCLISFMASAEPPMQGTKYSVKIDQQTYERVFIQCVSVFTNKNPKDLVGVGNFVQECDRTAQKIAYRSKFTSTDSIYYITAEPLTPEDMKH